MRDSFDSGAAAAAAAVSTLDDPREKRHDPVADKAAMPSGDGVEMEFLNRDLSWLEFNRRVLHEAIDARTPLLERVRFLGIFTSNLDEFFMKRASSLRRQTVKGVVGQTPDGRTPAEVFAAI